MPHDPRHIYELAGVEAMEPLADGVTVRKETLGFFRTLRETRAWLREQHTRAPDAYAPASSDESGYLYLRATRHGLGGRARMYEVVVFLDGDAKVRGTIPDAREAPWAGRDPATRRFSPGELVGCVSGHRYRVGVVNGAPLSPEEVEPIRRHVTRMDDVYLVGFVDRDPPHGFEGLDHAHPAEGEIVPLMHPISDGLRHALQRRFADSVRGNHRGSNTAQK